MANSDKNIVITPNTSQSADPQIVFSGADASTGPQNITVRVYPTNSGTLSFEGSAGQLFSVNNATTGTIFSANDVSGIPSIEVIDTGLVKLAQYGGNVLIGTGTDNGTEKLQVNGGILGTTIKGTQFTSTVSTGTAPMIVSSTTQVSNLNANLVGGLSVHTGTNNEANKIVRTDGNGYIQAGYIHSGAGNENNASNPPRVWGTNGSDSYMRTYQTASLSVGSASSAGTVTARNFTIGSTTRSVNHSADVSWSLADIGAAASSHTHNYAGSSSAGGQANTALVLSASDGTGYNTGMVVLAARSAVSNPNQYSYGLFLEFKNASVVSGLGNYAGLLTVAPYGGGTGSGDPNYQLGFSPQAADSTVPPTLRIRAGVATTWGSWSILTTAARTFAQNLILG